jgi:hypothetical protein
MDLSYNLPCDTLRQVAAQAALASSSSEQQVAMAAELAARAEEQRRCE